MTARLWDLYCRVVDNWGDVGVCWRLAADLAARGESVRLRIDDASALAWMAPHGMPGVGVLPWTAAPPDLEPGDVVIEMFGCRLPDAFVARMAARTPPPRWINLEYLSAEDYVERSHRLRSPQTTGPGAGLVKWFYYPGFTPATGGLIREPDLMQRRAAFDARTWLRSLGIEPDDGEQRISLFCYPGAPLERLLDAAARTPTLLLATTGAAADLVRSHLGSDLRCGRLRAVVLPALSQTDYDRLLWACDLNFVRGEDSFVRAQWAGVPFVWQIYPQADDVHARKLHAFLDRHLALADDAAFAARLRALWSAWNGLAPAHEAWPERGRWSALARDWRETLLRQADLTTQLIAFVDDSRYN
ncbi:MAG: elongation factor P maturation arginine rhamnosyltransferase EarP [Proteobacteria bacterium]|nr:elongation factor P maturation arginine rhamnosyltransferase EarP [Pseudomonadota bacterium]